MATRSEVLAKAADIRATFEAAGAQLVEPPVLQPSETLLDLYGEDIRARAYVTSDALRGEQMLRPDFTVPVVQMHMAHGADPARYTYAGEVFRRQEDDDTRANEFVQVGYEIFDRTNPAEADAEVFALVSEVLAPVNLTATTGDIGLIMAAVEGLDTTDDRKAALRRHIWRPRRFRALLNRFAGLTDIPDHRRFLLADMEPFSDPPPLVGRRTLEEIGARVSRLHRDLAAAPIAASDLELIEALLNVRETVPFALEQLRDLCVDLPSIGPAVDTLSARTEAMKSRGIDIEELAFDASYGRGSMEYYDGFVFGFTHDKRPDLPAIASGGRYDALTRQLGQGGEIPAVGGVLRPDLMLELEAAR